MKKTKVKGIYENQNSGDVMGLVEINIHEMWNGNEEIPFQGSAPGTKVIAHIVLHVCESTHVT